MIPSVVHDAAYTGSRELFRLASYATALGMAFGTARLFDGSFALGAFFAGMVLGETKLSQRATEETMPLRDAFALLFFVSVGMLFNPALLVEQPLAVLAMVLIIVAGKSVAAYAILRAFGHPAATALTVSASLARVGEFSFILVGFGITLGMLPEGGRDLVLAGAILSILLNPFVFSLIERRSRVVPVPSPEASETAGNALPDARPTGIPTLAVAAQPAPPAEPPMPLLPTAEEGPASTGPTNHDVIVGYGRVGSLVGARLAATGRPVFVFEEREGAIEAARRLFVTIPEAFKAGQVVQQARALSTGLEILARAHRDDCVRHLDRLGAGLTVAGEGEIAHLMLALAFPLWDSHRRDGTQPAIAQAR